MLILNHQMGKFKELRCANNIDLNNYLLCMYYNYIALLCVVCSITTFALKL